MGKLKVAPLSEYDKEDNAAVDRTLTVEITFADGSKESKTTSCCNPPACNPLLDPFCTG